MRNLLVLISTLCLLSIVACKPDPTSKKDIGATPIASEAIATTIYCGTYTKKENHVSGTAKGIHILKQDKQGKLSLVNTVVGTINPSFITTSVDGKYLYAVSETGGDVDTTAYVDAYKIVGDNLELINRKMSHGLFACHVSINDRFLAVSNYSGGKVALYSLLEDGAIGDLVDVLAFDHHGNHPRQESSHPHSFTFSPDGRCGYVCDLGGDRVYQFGFKSDTLEIYPLRRPFANMTSGAGPRHIDIHPDGTRAFIVTELDNKILSAVYNPSSGDLSRRSMLPTLPIGYNKPSFAADVHVHPSGNFVYASNRGHGSIAIYAVGQGTKLDFVDFAMLKGKTPRNFMITKDGNYLHVGLQDTNAVESFKIGQDGKLTALGLTNIPTPVCLIEAS